MVAGHTRCLVEGPFGLVKCKYRRSDVGSMPQLESAVDASAATNKAHLVNGSEMWREWDNFFNQFFHSVPQIQKKTALPLDQETLGQVFVRKSVDKAKVAVPLLKRNVTVAQVRNATLPAVITAPGLSLERQQYLFKEIRPDVAAECQDA